VSLQAILDAIHASGEDQVREIEAHTRAQVEQILEEAQVEARRLREEARAGAAAPAVGERARILHQARLEALQIVGDAREALVDAALSRTRECLAGMRPDAAYPATLRRLTKEALTELGPLEETGGARLEADPRDHESLEGILQGLGLELAVHYDLHCWGGLTAKSEDGRVVAINTLETRLERATSYLRRYLSVPFDEVTEDEECLAMTMAMPACGR
jgi:vacuolar-type H+-ATPase subunit E/Vma4